MMEIMFVAMAWLGLMSVFAFVLFLIAVVLCDPTGNKTHDGLLRKKR